MAGTSQNNYQVPPYPYQEEPSRGPVAGNYVSYPQIDPAQAREQDLKYGTSVMGAPANPDAHPDNQSAAAGAFPFHSSGSHREEVLHNQSQPSPSQTTTEGPYVQTTSATTPGKGKTMDQVKAQMQVLSKRAEETMNNMWGHLSTGTGGSETDNSWRKVAENAWGRVTAGTQILTKGGFEGVFKTTFPSTEADEKLLKTYACFLSTSTGPVAGTLYISNKRLAFCSDRPLKYLPAGKTEPAYSYYKVVVPNNKVKSVTPSASQKKPAEKYIQITTTDNFDFWYMGFVNYDKGVKNLQAVVNGNLSSPGVSQQHSFASHPPPYSEGTYTSTQQEQIYPPHQQQTYTPDEHNHYPPNVSSENYRRPSFSPNHYGTTQ